MKGRLVVVGLVAVALALIVLTRALRRESAVVPDSDARTPATAAAPQHVREAAPAAPPRRDLPSRDARDEAFDLDAGMAPSWEGVDLDAVREAMPDNLYWQMSSPTQDEKVLAERRAERERWNVEYGKVLSGTGSEKDVRNYYDFRARLFGDYVEFTTYLLDNYEASLPERDVRMLKLARGLALARLQEIPRKVEEAVERTRAQAAARATWRADEDAFAQPQQEKSAAADGEEDAQ